MGYTSEQTKNYLIDTILDFKIVETFENKIADYIEARYPTFIGLKEHLYGNLLRFWEGGK